MAKGAPEMRRSSSTVLTNDALGLLMAQGLSADQARALLKLTPVVRKVLEETPPTIEAQRDALREMKAAVHYAEKGFARAWHLTEPMNEHGVRQVIGRQELGLALRGRLERAHESIYGADTESAVRSDLDELLDLLGALERIVGEAIRQLPRKGMQKRRRVPTLPIKLIHDITPELPLQGAKFVEVVRIVYGNAGFPDHNPERAIRTFADSSRKKT